MARIRLTINVVIDLEPMIDVKRYSDKNKPILVNTAANRYLQYLRNRFARLATGRGEWPPIQPETVERKERRFLTDRPDWTLRETDFLFAGLRIAVRGGVTYVGYTHDLAHPRAPSVLFLARIHSTGGANLPRRPVVGLPPQRTRKAMADDIRKQYTKIIRKGRK